MTIQYSEELRRVTFFTYYIQSKLRRNIFRRIHGDNHRLRKVAISPRNRVIFSWMETIYNHFSFPPFGGDTKSSTNFSYVHFIQSRWFSFSLHFFLPPRQLDCDSISIRFILALPCHCLLFLRSLKNESLRDFQANWFSIILIAKLVWLWRTEDVKLFHFLAERRNCRM